MRLTSSLACLVLAASASAAEVTDLPPRLRADVHVRYDGLFQQAGLEEEGTTFALRNHRRDEVAVRAELGVHHGLVLTLGLPVTASQQIRWAAARSMVLDPIDGRGTYIPGPRIPEDELPHVRGGGVQGVWVGLAASPFREDEQRGLPVTTRFDVALRTPAPRGTLYGEARGGSPGGLGVLVSGAFSVRRGKAEPYLVVGWQHDAPVEVDVLYPDGRTAEGVRVGGEHRADARVGAELVALDLPDRGHRFAFDLWTGFGYRSAERAPSGFWLPDTLPSTLGLSVARSELLLVRAGLALDLHVTRYVGLRVGTEGRYLLPHRVEHPFAVRTDPQSYEVTWTAAIVGRVRTRGDRP